MPHSPRISVIIATRNRPQLLEQALESVRRQDLADFECIVVDDASQDFSATESVVHRLHDPRFRVIQSRDVRKTSAESLARYGKGLALNIGIEQAASDWLSFLDDDDLYAPYRLSRGLQSLEAQPGARVVVARSSHFAGPPPEWSPEPPLKVHRLNNPMAQMMPHFSGWTLSRALAYEAGLFRPYNLLEDWEFYAQLRTLTTIWCDDATVSAIRRHDGARNNYGLHARVEMRQRLIQTGALCPNWSSRAFQMYRLSLLELNAGYHLGAVAHAMGALFPVPYPRYVRQAVRALADGLRHARYNYA